MYCIVADAWFTQYSRSLSMSTRMPDETDIQLLQINNVFANVCSVTETQCESEKESGSHW